MAEARIIDGKRIAEELRNEIALEAAEFLKKTGIQPRAVFILVGNNPASEVYVRNKGLAAEQAGFSHETIALQENTSESALIDLIRAINADPATHGLLVQFPLPRHINEEHIIEALSPDKDVDGFHPINAGRLLIGKGNFFAPCTPAGVIEILYREKIEVSGKHAVIVGRSNLVGKPLAMLLAQKNPKANAVATIAHTGAGSRLVEITRQADILIAAMGVPLAITSDMVKPGAVVIDVGINRIEDASKKSGYRLVGDVDFEAVRHIASAITPVPGGVGPMTIAMLLKNTLTAAERQILK
ncbi:MAG: bifunctional 5,10-methylenetetrahydrofolate dehydrogenase/5,10-methenyltetrahydrofolate cyclohydrolase [Bacteroidota bacterium]|nr:bifunctional 5,10-methylenetetrahydrofolate dehydrogenase/5,10-methenyltetrahydrofolate cyclohydrolase [Bacteroidota bacterium]MDP4233756.1 bifunctional 5,10-methylenetetrahydrofolate dehydrogenase/5,10-methenyltetrahydrofolate cyclohydrolase [Bacteroidota bacterium]MDP4242395.1 bifunctional 5,10-methylenetetrahydrofolate dehydrogenase/5,10-methenyltetrahydrofolate cyclohydrolase [Bacteroidota bacterium]MDP4287517.1 bifunctional 5,10-methylenetetrahydrofolate dehydrogenase/5,10-methenyltetrah